MEPIPPKSPGDFLLSSEFNSFFDGSQNAIIDSGQTLTATDAFQLSRAMAINAMGSDFFQNSGSTVNNYIVTSVGSKRAPQTLFNGMRVRFRPSVNNTGLSNLTVAGVGPTEIVQADGVSTLIGGEIATTADTAVRFDSTTGKFILLTLSVVNAQETIRGLAFLPKRIILSNNTGSPLTDIDFSAGNFIFSDGSGAAVGPAFTKVANSVFVVGTGAGGLDVTPLIEDLTYHVYSVFNPTSGASDYTLSLNAVSPTLVGALTPFTKSKRIGSVLTVKPGSTVDIQQFVQIEKYFYLVTEVDSGVTSITITEQTITLDVPVGIQTIALINIIAATTNPAATITAFYRLYPFSFNADTVTVKNAQISAGRRLADFTFSGSSSFGVLTDLLSQIKGRSSSNTDNSTVVSTRGWIDLNLEG